MKPMRSMSLKYRIAVTMLVLQAVVLAFVLWRVLTMSLDNTRTQLVQAESVTLRLLEDLARRTLLTAEYDEFQLYIDRLASDPRIDTVVLSDDRARVVASTDRAFVGGAPPGTPESGDFFWIKRDIRNVAGPMGLLAVRFSNVPVHRAYRRAWRAGLWVGALGLAGIAVVSISMGFLLTRRLGRLVGAARRLSRGERQVTADVGGADEVGRLGDTFNRMARSIDDHVTALQRARDELQLRVRELEQANRLKSEFLSTVSHELRTPLNVIIGYADMLAEGGCGELNETERKIIAAIRGYSGLQLKLITDVLDFSRLSSGKVSFHVEHFDPAPLLAEVAALYRGRLGNPDIRLEVAAAPGTPALETDRVKFQEILYNLVDNAVKFTSRGEIRISARPSADGRSVVVEVSDTGPGIPAEDLDHIFDPFRQVGKSSTRETGGVGLGLSIVKNLVEVLGGAIAVESRLGSGTTFRVEIPCRLRADGGNGSGTPRAG